jgi:hypothetical protein
MSDNSHTIAFSYVLVHPFLLSRKSFFSSTRSVQWVGLVDEDDEEESEEEKDESEEDEDEDE